jgi:transcriptional regulator with GAF, ATPase, and Fis domain
MTPRKPKPSKPSKPSKASKPSEPGPDLPWEARLAALLAEIRDRLGPEEASRAARAAFAACARDVFGEGAAPPGLPQGAPPGRAAFRYEYSRIVGESPALLAVLRTLDRIIDSELPVVITGESGTGKELIARAIHENGPRAGRAFVRENCAAIPESLLESELFGYRKGAFTGATHDKRGLFEEGDGGSVFLDEIGEMSLGMQSKLMRVLQEGEIRPVGSPSTIRVDVRLISATNRDLRKLVAEGRFREDLFFRLNVVGIHMPPLRERAGDVPILVEAFLRAAAKRTGGPPKKLDPAALECLVRHDWPGNVRELENEIQRAYALSGPTIRVSDLSPEVLHRPAGREPKRTAAKTRRN